MVGLDIILGGITGLLGNCLTTWFKYKNIKLDHEHKEKMVSLETQAMIQESQMQIEVTKSRIEGEIELADASAFETSQKIGTQKLFHEKWIDMIMTAGKGKWYGGILQFIGSMIAAGFALVDWLNGMMRPSLTIYLVGVSSYITVLAWEIMKTHGLDLTADQAVAIFSQVSSTMIYLSVSCVTWWMGDRTMSKFLQERGDKKISGYPTKPSGGGGGDVDL